MSFPDLHPCHPSCHFAPFLKLYFDEYDKWFSILEGRSIFTLLKANAQMINKLYLITATPEPLLKVQGGSKLCRNGVYVHHCQIIPEVYRSVGQDSLGTATWTSVEYEDLRELSRKDTVSLEHLIPQVGSLHYPGG
jgi:hypothetical protein